MAARSAAATWIATVLLALSGILIARHLGPESYGLFVAVLAATATVAALLDVTVEEGLIRLGSTALAQGRVEEFASLVRRSYVVDLACGFVVFALVSVFAGAVLRVLPDSGASTVEIRLAALSVLAKTLNGASGGLLTLARRPDRQAIAAVIEGCGRCATVVFLIAAEAATVSRLLVAFAAWSAVAAGLQNWFSWRAWKDVLRGGSRASRMYQPVRYRIILSFAAYATLGMSAIALRESAVPLILLAVADAEAVGHLAVAMLPVMIAATTSSPLRTAVFAEQSRLAAIGDLASVAKTTWAYTGAGAVLGVTAAAIGFVVMPDLLALLYGERYADAAAPARILLVSAVLHLAFGWTKTISTVLGVPRAIVLSALLELAVVACGVAFLGRYGASGGAVAVVIGHGVIVAAWVVWFPKLLKRDAMLA